MRETPDRIMVPFSGDGAGIDRLTWGQADHYAAMIRMKTWSPLGGVAPLEPGKTVADITEELRYLMSRFPSVRTRLRYDTDGRPDQRSFGMLDVAVQRNGYGRQRDSFEAPIEVLGLGAGGAAATFPAVFIRAPRITRVGASSRSSSICMLRFSPDTSAVNRSMPSPRARSIGPRGLIL